MMRDRFVAGIKSEILQKKLLQEDDDVTLDKVFAVAISFELAEINTRELKDNSVAKISPDIDLGRALTLLAQKVSWEQLSKVYGRIIGVLDRLRFLPIKKKMDQRTCIKFCVKNEIKCVDAFRMLTVAYGEATLDRSNVYRWYKMFSEGREDVNDEERAGRPSTSTTDEKINEVEKMILANRRITVREVSEDLNISIGSCHSIFINDLGMRRVAAKFVPKLLNCDQKQHRMNIANEMLDSVRDDPNLLQRVITGDEAWVYGYDVETKAQSSQWKLPHEPRPKKARQVRSNVKVLLTVFFDCRGVVHHKFLPQGRTVNKEYYLQVMRNLREAIRQKRPDLWKNKN
ncbi:hypothetical protein LAZ67_9000550 [Cordylochernes scorpioides]|uniref:Mos1 transposase HTH domain-containing protein n=1 Tax=Cordylochernes scorpioides TaxID=51811 RepID=A0ABY6KXK4_9ARAC|nr:hypothetical protein LAZ67_9000550 [Cordylochernes scorpioides]